tara:strand:- start:45 stop:851 length:807 start_codon:yes stop_codon:yes gene_type:complete
MTSTLKVQNIQYTDGDAALTIADGGGVTAASTLSIADNTIIGTAGTGASSTSPKTLSLGSTFSSVAGDHPKLKLYEASDGHEIGIGISSNQMDFQGTSTDFDYVFYGNGNKLMHINGTGEITTPQQPAFQAYYASNTYCWSDTTDGGSHLQTLSSTRFNRGNHYNTTNHRFIAPVAGIYHFYGQFYTNYASNYARYGAFIYVNGVARSETWNPGWETAGSAVTTLTIELAANDYVQLYTAVYDSNATSNTYNVYCAAGYTYLNGHLVG